MQALLIRASKEFDIVNFNSPASGGKSGASAVNYLAIRNLALVDILFATGIRVGEAASLDINDFSQKDGMFRIKGKGGRDRVGFAVDEKSLKIQKDHLKARVGKESKSSALFLNRTGNRLSTQGITNVIARLCREGGIEKHVTPHMLRHTVATLLLRNGVDIRVVQEFLGHASIATTQRYTHISKEHLISVLKRSHPSLTLRNEPPFAAV
jgi:integrase/recombinase XerD